MKTSAYSVYRQELTTGVSSVYTLLGQLQKLLQLLTTWYQHINQIYGGLGHNKNNNSEYQVLSKFISIIRVEN